MKKISGNTCSDYYYMYVQVIPHKHAMMMCSILDFPQPNEPCCPYNGHHIHGHLPSGRAPRD